MLNSTDHITFAQSSSFHFYVIFAEERRSSIIASVPLNKSLTNTSSRGIYVHVLILKESCTTNSYQLDRRSKKLERKTMPLHAWHFVMTFIDASRFIACLFFYFTK